MVVDALKELELEEKEKLRKLNQITVVEEIF